jgi:hypothetical protein
MPTARVSRDTNPHSPGWSTRLDYANKCDPCCGLDQVGVLASYVGGTEQSGDAGLLHGAVPHKPPRGILHRMGGSGGRLRHGTGMTGEDMGTEAPLKRVGEGICLTDARFSGPHNNSLGSCPGGS